jgi:hypothetical protein
MKSFKGQTYQTQLTILEYGEMSLHNLLLISPQKLLQHLSMNGGSVICKVLTKQAEAILVLPLIEGE